MSLDKIQQLVGSLAKSLDDNEQIATPVLAAKLAKCVVAYPGDQTMGTMQRVIDSMVSNNTLFIRKAELRTLYNKLYSRNTKFAEVFEGELGIVKAAVKEAPKHEVGNYLDTYKVADQVLANALPSLFDKHLPVKMFSRALAEQAIQSVGTSLDAWGLRPTSLSVDEGNDKFLVIKADYDTPKGLTSFYVPVEINNNKISEAAIFMGNSGPLDLNHSAIKKYVTSNAGHKLKVNAATILGALTTASSENREISDTELAMTRLSATRQGKSEFFEGSIVGQKMAEATKNDVKLPRSAHFNDFEKQFNTVQGLATLKFGESKVKTAATHITRELLSMGHKNPQIAVIGHDDNTISYGISLNDGRLAFTVPVKVAGGKLQKPELLICNGSIKSFDEDGVKELSAENRSDHKVAAVASPQYGLKPSDLLNNIRAAIADGNHAKAEDALNILANANDPKAYAAGFNLFKQALSNKPVAVESKCTHMVKSSKSTVSEHPVCGQTGLPTNKVYQDQHGNCRPLYRKGMDETYEGASFINAKIFG